MGPNAVSPRDVRQSAATDSDAAVSAAAADDDCVVPADAVVYFLDFLSSYLYLQESCTMMIDNYCYCSIPA